MEEIIDLFLERCDRNLSIAERTIEETKKIKQVVSDYKAKLCQNSPDGPRYSLYHSDLHYFLAYKLVPLYDDRRIKKFILVMKSLIAERFISVDFDDSEHVRGLIWNNGDYTECSKFMRYIYDSFVSSCSCMTVQIFSKITASIFVCEGVHWYNLLRNHTSNRVPDSFMEMVDNA